MHCVTGVYLRDLTHSIFVILHFIVSPLSVCSSCFYCNDLLLLKMTVAVTIIMINKEEVIFTTTRNIPASGWARSGCARLRHLNYDMGQT